MFSYLYRNRVGALTGAGTFAVLYGSTVLWKTRDDKYEEELSPEDPEEASRQKVYAVTGANSGIGKALVEGLAKNKNNKVYMLCRDMESCENKRKQIVFNTSNKYVYCRPCDLASFKSIRECAQKLNEPQIDALINNAGVMYAPRSVTEDGFEVHWGVNHLGPYLLTRLLSDKLVGGRVVYMIHLDYKYAKNGILFDDINMQENYDKHYAFYQSQLANVFTIQKLAEEFKDKSITVNGVYPGNCKDTKIKRYMSIDKSITATLLARPMMWFLEKTPSEGAYTPLFMTVDRSVGGLTGKLYANMAEMSILDIGVNSEDAQRLMAIDDYWSGLKSKEEILEQKKLSKPDLKKK